MFFVFYATTNKELCKADAIACNYIEAKLKNLKDPATWQAKGFVVNSPIAKLAEFWIDNAENLEEAIAAETWSYKTIDQLTPQDYQAKYSVEQLCYRHHNHVFV
jgi:hypothetical protein